MEYVSAQEIAAKWGISKRRVQILCATNRIKNAVRIGNMWVVPNMATKPEDARYKDKVIEEPQTRKTNPIRVARTRIKKLSVTTFNALVSFGYSMIKAKNTTVILFATELLNYRCNHASNNNCNIRKEACTAISSLFGQTLKIREEILNKFSADFQQFVHDNPFCSDDALAWCYQFVNKESKDNGLHSTQFFTEKYMITTLVDAMNISSTTGVILDPACGGGNFLLYCFDTLADNTISPNDNLEKVMSKLEAILVRLCGYEIDPMLAAVASINIRLKAIDILSAHGISVGVSDFLNTAPNIFHSVNTTKLGALDFDRSHHKVVSVGSCQYRTMQDIFSNIDYLFTNPPFQTVKGMDKELKEYLKANYPNSKCDVCNAFIHLTVELLNPMGCGGLVTQNSWLYLDSFVAFRKHLLSACTIQSVIELGANAFYDLSGEKSNVTLLSLKKEIPSNEAEISLFSLKTLSQPIIEKLLSSHSDVCVHEITVLQEEILSSSSARFDMFSSDHLKAILQKHAPYGKFALPMQGTSTGNAKELLNYYWHHFGDSEWVPVSKGGGYSRWQGLNSYCVKWGKNGEYIKAMPGSAIRNASYFKDTQLVFSDTGTSGLNVRVLLPGQLFVASGPGIRRIQGDVFAHMAFLNSRFASYYIRLLSPKLTIAAGYIAKLPIIEKLLFSKTLSSNAKRCITSKKRRLSKHPCNIEFQLSQITADGQSLFQSAYDWFLEDISDEWTQLRCEQAIEDEISMTFALSKEDISAMEAQIGIKRVYSNKNEKLLIKELKDVLPNLFNGNSTLLRNRANKASLGCDGLLEYVAQKLDCSCEAVYNSINQADIYSSIFKERYEGLLLHSLTLVALNFGSPVMPTDSPITVDEIATEIGRCYPNIVNEQSTIVTWLRNRFNNIHVSAFMNSPIYTYNCVTDSIEYLKDKNI